MMKRSQVFLLWDFRLLPQRGQIRGRAANVSRCFQIKRLDLAGIGGSFPSSERDRHEVFFGFLAGHSMVRRVVFLFAGPRTSVDRGGKFILEAFRSAITVNVTAFFGEVGTFPPLGIRHFRNYCRILCFRTMNSSVLRDTYACLTKGR